MLPHTCDLGRFVVAADEAYQLLAFPGGAASLPPPLRHSDARDGYVVSLGTFSKVAGPGLRLGWLQASEHVRAQLLRNGVILSGGALNPLVAGLMQWAMQSKLQVCVGGWVCVCDAVQDAGVRVCLCVCACAMQSKL